MDMDGDGDGVGGEGTRALVASLRELHCRVDAGDAM
jgi:hypothetical protein